MIKPAAALVSMQVWPGVIQVVPPRAWRPRGAPP